MSRDMKPSRRATQPARKKSGGGTLIGMFIGLVLGVGIAAGVVLYMNKSPLPFQQKVPAAKDAPTVPAAVPAAAAKGQPVQEPLALPGKPGDPVPEKRFQFYDILPGKSEPKPDKQGAVPAEPKKEEAKKDDSKDSKTPLFLQAGSFSTAQDADNQKAKLAFLGHEAVVQQVMVQDKTFYRVRVGPYLRIDDLNKTRSELAKAGIESQLVKNKE